MIITLERTFMARKSIHVDVKFIIPKEEDGKKVLAEAMGDVHIKIIKEILNKKEGRIKEKNYIYKQIQKELSKQADVI